MLKRNGDAIGMPTINGIYISIVSGGREGRGGREW